MFSIFKSPSFRQRPRGNPPLSRSIMAVFASAFIRRSMFFFPPSLVSSTFPVAAISIFPSRMEPPVENYPFLTFLCFFDSSHPLLETIFGILFFPSLARPRTACWSPSSMACFPEAPSFFFRYDASDGILTLVVFFFLFFPSPTMTTIVAFYAHPTHKQ